MNKYILKLLIIFAIYGTVTAMEEDYYVVLHQVQDQTESQTLENRTEIDSQQNIEIVDEEYFELLPEKDFFEQTKKSDEESSEGSNFITDIASNMLCMLKKETKEIVTNKSITVRKSSNKKRKKKLNINPRRSKRKRNSYCSNCKYVFNSKEEINEHNKNGCHHWVLR